MKNSRIAMENCTNNMTIWRHEQKKIRKERNNFKLSRTKVLIQENSNNSKKNQLNYSNCQGTQTRLLSGRLTNFPMLKVFSNMYLAKTITKKWFFFFFFSFFFLFLFLSFFLLFAFFSFFFYVETTKISRSSTFFYLYMYIFRQEH